MSTKRTKLGRLLTALLVIAAAVCGIVGGRIVERRNLQWDLYEAITKSYSSAAANGSTPTNKITYTLSLIENNYVDSIVLDSLSDEVIPLILEQLDPHSIYIPAKDMQGANESLEGEFDGIGVVFNMATDTVIVLNVISAGPSDKAGIISGDRIVMINDSLVAGNKTPQSNVMSRLRGKRGSIVKLGIERQGADEILDIEVTRGVIPIKSIGTALILEDSIGYIKMSQFARTTHTELLGAIAKLQGDGMRSLILDLRGNSGGYLDQAIRIANEFLPNENLIVYTEDRDGKQIREYSDGTGQLPELDIAILIDENSASSSEILAGALQDNDRGVTIGRRSFGKGLVQQQIPFRDGSAVRLTIARYYTPTGRSIQKPYDSGESDSYNHDLVDRYNNNELFSADSIHFADSLKKLTPKGKVVYGGGGIMPDIFVPADTTDITKYFIKVSAMNIIYNFTTKYADAHREQINSITTLEELNELFAKDKNMLNDFVRYASTQGVKPNWSEINTSRELIEAQLRAYIGRNTKLEDNAFYASIYHIDNVILKAIEELTTEPQPEEALN